MAEEAYAASVHVIRDSEEPSLPSDEPRIKAACELLASGAPEIDEPRDIEDIIQSCVKEVKTLKQHNHMRTIKMLTQLIAISEYIKLHALYKSTKTCKQPCLRASITIANRMGKGLYFACQI